MKKPAGGGFAAGTSGGSAGVTESNLDRAKRIIAQREEKQGSMRVKGAAPPA